jgi:hypothetical protein
MAKTIEWQKKNQKTGTTRKTKGQPCPEKYERCGPTIPDYLQPDTQAHPRDAH